MAAKRVLLVGDHAHEDFREAVAWLHEHTRLVQSASVLEALAVIGQATEVASTAADESDAAAAGWRIPDVIIIAQSRPGQFSPQQIACLHAASPLSRLVVMAGSWSEGELRSGRPCPGVIRILWHQWQPRLMPFMQGGSTPLPGLWRLPRTASLDEQLASTVGPMWPAGEGLIAIHAESREAFEALSEACRQGGYATCWYAEEPDGSGGAVAVLADGISCDSAGADFLRDVVQRQRPAPVVALLDFVRRQDYAHAQAAGVAAVLAKPFLVYDLLWHLAHAIGGAGGFPGMNRGNTMSA